MKTKLLLMLPLAIGSLLCSCGGGTPEANDKYTLEFTLTEEGNAYAVTGITYEDKEAMHNVVIPNVYNELPVTVLGNKNANLLDKIYNVFYRDSSLKSLVMGNNITTIVGDYLCNGCENLETVTFSDHLEEVLGNETFSSCKSLKEAILPDSLTKVSDNFMAKAGLTKLVLPKNIEKISLRAFADNENLNDITWPEVDFSGGASAFCNSGFVELTVPDTMVSQGSTFASSKKLTKVNTGRGLKSLNGAFKDCPNLVEFYLTKECTSIYYSSTGEIQSSFYGCTSLDEIHYEGTMDEFNTKVFKEENWNKSGCRIMRVICSDGTIEY